MNNDNQIKYLKYDDIDPEMWDTCIAESASGLVYGYTWYLDRICEKWDALIYGNYRYVMPLIYNKKWGIKYLYQPTYCQQLGVFPAAPIEIVQAFLDEVNKRFRFAEINLNGGSFPGKKFQAVSARNNYTLDLFSRYNELEKNYSAHTIRHLKKAAKNNLNLAIGLSIDEYLAFKELHLKDGLTRKPLENLRKLVSFLLPKGLCRIYAVYNNENRLCAAAVFLYSPVRVTYLNAVSSDEGRSLDAMYFLVDQFIREHAGLNLTLDFEGSVIAGIARFYGGFGATPEKYYHYRLNRLPLFLRWLKK